MRGEQPEKHGEQPEKHGDHTGSRYENTNMKTYFCIALACWRWYSIVTIVEDVESAFAGSAAAPRTRPVLGALPLLIDVGRDRVRDVAVRLPARKRYTSIVSGQRGSLLELGEGWEGAAKRPPPPSIPLCTPIMGNDRSETGMYGETGCVSAKSQPCHTNEERASTPHTADHTTYTCLLCWYSLYNT